VELKNPKKEKNKVLRSEKKAASDHVSRNVHAKTRQGCGTEAAQISCRHVWNMGSCYSGHPLHSSLSQPRERGTQARALDSCFHGKLSSNYDLKF